MYCLRSAANAKRIHNKQSDRAQVPEPSAVNHTHSTNVSRMVLVFAVVCGCYCCRLCHCHTKYIHVLYVVGGVVKQPNKLSISRNFCPEFDANDMNYLAVIMLICEINPVNSMGSLRCSIERLTGTQISNTNALFVLTYAIQRWLPFLRCYWIEAHLPLRALGSCNMSANTTVHMITILHQIFFLIHVGWMKDSCCLVNIIQWFVNICVYLFFIVVAAAFSISLYQFNLQCHFQHHQSPSRMLHLTQWFIHTRI